MTSVGACFRTRPRAVTCLRIVARPQTHSEQDPRARRWCCGAATWSSAISAHILSTADDVSQAAAMVFSGLGSGSGSSLPLPLLLTAGLCTVVATFVSAMSIVMHLKNYRKPHLQRCACPALVRRQRVSDNLSFRQVIRIMLMVPLYAIASFISLFSLEAAFFIDAVRDIYEVSTAPFLSRC